MRKGYVMVEASKVCNKCNVEKSTSDFYKVKDRKSGIRAQCKQCFVDYRLSKNDEYLAYHRSKYQKTKDKVAERLKAYRKTPKGKEVAKTTRANQFRKFPEKFEARRQFAWAVKSGKILRQPCEVCGASKADGHHEDYSKPLEVRWLCRTHHTERHNELRLEELSNKETANE